MNHSRIDRLWDWIRLRADAEKGLRGLINELVRHVLSGTVLAERDVNARRKAEDELGHDRGGRREELLAVEAQTIGDRVEPVLETGRGVAVVVEGARPS